MTFDRFLLRSSARWITLEPADAAVPPSEVLFIDRKTCKASVRDRIDCAALAEPDAEEVVFGLVGLVRTVVDMYLIVVRARESVGPVLEEPVWRVKRLAAVPVRGANMLKGMPTITAQQRTEEAALHAMLLSALALPGFYFSHGLDLTRPAQAGATAAESPSNVPAIPNFARADMTFVWNRFAAKPLADLGLVSWLVPLVLGYVAVRKGMVNGRSVALTLIARRAADRPGLRFTARGADIRGNVSNYVQTEQIVAHGDAFASYVLLRGSIPLLWKQEACIRYKPEPELKIVDAGGKEGLSQAAFERHFGSIIDVHGPVTAVSLIDTKGGEAVLGEAFGQAVEHMGSSKVRYVPWDFHAKTKGMKYENVDLDLIPTLEADIARYSYYLCTDSAAGTRTRTQTGVFRVNCIDSLDRTNVVQCVIAHHVMDDALRQLGVLDPSPESTAAKFVPFERQFKAAWADHADAIAYVYSGSGALKTDYTRTGKRTKPGMAVDGMRSAMRYLYQNFWDGRRQDGIDLFLGVVEPSGDVSSHRSIEKILSKAEPLQASEKFLPHAFALCLLLAVAGVVVPQKVAWKGTSATVALGAAGFVFMKIMAVGHKLAARPKFNGTN